MFRVYTCLTVDHDWRLILLAAVVCFAASAVAISLFHRAQATAGRTRLVWMGLDAAAAGCGIWATHFIAMLAYVPAVNAGYNLTLTVLSLLIAVLITGAGFGMALLNPGRWTSAIGGVVVGGGIAAMHYTGMMALELPGRIIWSANLVTASIVFGVVFGAVAVFYAARRDDWANTMVAIVSLTLAIVAMHFTAMGAVLVLPDPTRLAGAGTLSPYSFSIVIASATTIILGMCFVAAFSDRRWKGKLRQQKDLLDAALESMLQGLCMYDAEGRILLFNRRFAEMVGFTVDELKGKTLLDLIERRKERGEFSDDPKKYFEELLAEIRRGEMYDRQIKSVSGRMLRVVQQPRPDGGWVSTLEDITEWRAAQARTTHMAHHDALTDLANRTQLVKKLEDSLVDLRSRGDTIAVHFIDVDRFKSINDSLGHDGGDVLLKAVAERLRAAIRANDMVARLGGDEFVVVQTGIKSRNQAEDFARRLTSAMSVPITLNEQSTIATVSVGVALAPADGTNAERLLKSADLALYKAKADGRNCVRFFQFEMDAELQVRTKLERTIRDAVQHDRFELHYQPLFEMSERRLIGFRGVDTPSHGGRNAHPATHVHSTC